MSHVNYNSEFKGRNIRCIKEFNQFTFVGSRTGVFVFDKELNLLLYGLVVLLNFAFYCWERGFSEWSRRLGLLVDRLFWM